MGALAEAAEGIAPAAGVVEIGEADRNLLLGCMNFGSGIDSISGLVHPPEPADDVALPVEVTGPVAGA